MSNETDRHYVIRTAAGEGEPSRVRADRHTEDEGIMPGLKQLTLYRADEVVGVYQDAVSWHIEDVPRKTSVVRHGTKRSRWQ